VVGEEVAHHMPGQAARQRLAVKVRALFPGEPDDVLLPRQEVVELMRLAGKRRSSSGSVISSGVAIVSVTPWRVNRCAAANRS
jgi:hypothetical protein